MSSDTLTPKQLRFCRAYIECGVGKEAAITAGYSERTAAQIAYELLKREKVQKFIERAGQDAADQIQLETSWIIERLKAEAEDSENKGSERIRALELLGKVKQLFVEKKEVHHTHEGTFFASVDLSEPVEGEWIEGETIDDETLLIEHSDHSEDD